MLIYRTAGGGGWKDRLDRPVEAVERDVAFGLVSRREGAVRVRRGRRATRRPRRPSGRASGPSAATRWRSTSGRRSRRCSPAARRRRGCRRPCGRSRCAGRRWRTPARRGIASGGRGAEVAAATATRHDRAGGASAGRRASAAAPRWSSSTSNRGFTDPASPLGVRPRRRRSRRTPRGARRGARAPACRCSSRRSCTTRWARPRPPCSCARCPRWVSCDRGRAWVEIDQRLGRRPRRAGHRQGARLGVLRRAARRACSRDATR